MRETIFVPTTPIAWKRPQINYTTRTMFTAPVQRIAREVLHQALKEEWDSRGHVQIPAHLPVRVATLSVIQRPPSHLDSTGNLNPTAPGEHTEAPDVDNLLKLQLDALKGSVLHDDRQIVKLSSRKSWADVDEVEGVHFQITWGEDDESERDDVSGDEASCTTDNDVIDLTQDDTGDEIEVVDLSDEE